MVDKDKRDCESGFIYFRRLVRGFAFRIWEVFCCWLVVPSVFGYLAYLSIHKKEQITIMQVVLASLALLPWLLNLASRYLSEFNFGLTGVFGKTRQSVLNKDEVDKKLDSSVKDTQPPANVHAKEEQEYESLLPQTKKVLRTLWKFQRETFGDDDARRWGFNVGTGAPDYQDYILGVFELLKSRLAIVDDRSFLFLTKEGIEFCKKHSPDISAYPFVYDKFGN